VLAALAAKKLKYYVCDFQRSADRKPASSLTAPGASTREAEDKLRDIWLSDELRDYLEHGNIRNAVNFPDVVMTRESQFPGRHRECKRS
jgi:D-3-phosphoglycerate dehydrogenase